MIHFGNKIQLTPSENDNYFGLTNDGCATPTTIQDHDTRLDLAAIVWTQIDTAEGRLLAALCESLKIVPSTPKVKLKLVLSAEEALRRDFGTRWEVDASELPLTKMLKKELDEGDCCRERGFSSKLPDEFAQEIRELIERYE